MDKISCIVLNYNDARTTCGLVEELLGINCLDSVVVVDNCSTDDSWVQLSGLARPDGRVSLIRAEQNGGYGWGNQIGVDWAVDRLGADYVIVAIDASVGSPDHVGYATLGRGALQPGLGVSKNLEAVGDISITGIVGGAGSRDPVMLQSVRLSIVMKMADCICEGICLVERLWDNAAII